MENKQHSFLTLPGAIIVAGAIIAIAIIWVKQPAAPTSAPADNQAAQTAVNINLSPVTADDHILGNPQAAIKIVEYSDPSCPYCKAFNATMVDIMNQYGPEGTVAWVYRSFPLDKPDQNGNILHPNAGHESEALECVALLGGNDKFWNFEKTLYSTTPSVTAETPQGLDQKLLPGMAKSVGIDEQAFNDCLSSGKTKTTVDAQSLSGTNAGVSGTPTSFLVLESAINPTAVTYIKNALVQYRVPPDLLFVSDDKKTILMSGAMPEAMVKGLLDSLLGH